MKITLKSKNRKENFFTYIQEIEDHNCISQQVFSAFLFIFFALRIIVIYMLDFEQCDKLYTIISLTFFQILLGAITYLLFKYYFVFHKKYAFWIALLNISITLGIMEVQYFLYGEYVSYTIIIGMVLCSSLSIIGHTCKYAAVITLNLVVDIIITILKNPELIHSHDLNMYIIDNIFILFLATGMNYGISCLKYNDFEKNRQILYLSERDSLTGLLNRKSFEYSVEKYTGSDGLCAMILLDLDNFKALNDTLGHYAGDDCLRETADELKKVFRSDDYVSRLGGDEFTVFLPNIKDTAFVKEQANILLNKIPRSYSHQSGEIMVTCSVGIAFLMANQEDLYERLYKAADAAMYMSKESGKNRSTVFPNKFSEI